jgi:hypothetical protein
VVIVVIVGDTELSAELIAVTNVDLAKDGDSGLAEKLFTSAGILV